jgi:hypothetical protein
MKTPVAQRNPQLALNVGLFAAKLPSKCVLHRRPQHRPPLIGLCPSSGPDRLTPLYGPVSGVSQS